MSRRVVKFLCLVEFHLIQSAYEILCDTAARAAYDNVLKYALSTPQHPMYVRTGRVKFMKRNGNGNLRSVVACVKIWSRRKRPRTQNVVKKPPPKPPCIPNSNASARNSKLSINPKLKPHKIPNLPTWISPKCSNSNGKTLRSPGTTVCALLIS